MDRKYYAVVEERVDLSLLEPKQPLPLEEAPAFCKILHPKKKQHSRKKQVSSERMKRKDFHALKSAIRQPGRFFVLQTKNQNGPAARLGVTVTKKYGSAVERNRFKRLAREAFRALFSSLPSNLDVHLFPRFHSKKAKMQDLQQELAFLLKIPT